MYRTKNCGELNISNVSEEVILAGHIQKIRNFGSMVFIDLRDQYGITQVVLRDELADKLTTESSIQVQGKVVERSNKNPNISTGDIEVNVENLKVLGKCKVNLPFEINEEYENNKEDLRLEYRYLDLRNRKIHENIIHRAEIMRVMREEMNNLGFIEIQTPIFTNSSPEGARDYLVPSRIHKGEFYALPQSPQQLKQLLMVSGFDKYFQIAPCFRDEDPRADRLPCEFYQLDFEMAYAEQDDVLNVLETLLYNTYVKTVKEGREVDKPPFLRIPYKEAIEKYGIDKPDLRNPLVLYNVSDVFNNTDIQIFKDKTTIMQVVNKIESRKVYDELTEKIKNIGGKGLAWAKIEENGEITGGISKLLNEDILNKLREYTDISNNTSIFLIADEDKDLAYKLSGELRIELGKAFDLLKKDVFKFCFIMDFPMYELNDDGKIDFSHNPFSMPQGGLETLNTKDPLDILAYQYDVVCNGFEIASGAVRNHDIDIMVKAFEIARYSKEEVEKQFGALYTAFQYGAPPHAGAAPGIDRIIMLICEVENVREITAFPKNKKAQDLMVGAPSHVSQEQIDELGIEIKKEKKEEV